jgi:hypothetical protein
MINRQDYLAIKEKKKQKKLDAGLIADRFPRVLSIMIHMTYFQKSSDQVFMERTVNFSPASYAYFHMGCLTKDCVNGGFQLTPVIKGLIKNKKTNGKGKLVCRGKNDSSAPGHVNISYEIRIKYGKKSH